MIRVANPPHEDYGDLDPQAYAPYTPPCSLCGGTKKVRVGIEPPKGTPEYRRAQAQADPDSWPGGVPLIHYEYECWKCNDTGELILKGIAE